MYAVELRFAIPDLTCSPSSDVVAEGLLRGRSDLGGHVEHVRAFRRNDTFHAVLFVTAASPQEATVIGRIVGLAAAADISAIRFVDVQPWPGTDEPDAGG